ncbi:N-formylglutamate deformylase [Massilia sp. METH4]|uniref:N-formylglutamate deformylase n=1 Tax=Massilia sp. METH4 TaxID=3123041 RepID=UPI0030D190C7
MNHASFHFTRGKLPLLISIPHLGTAIPPDLKARMTDAATGVADTDWHLDQLYETVAATGASVISACVSRYVIDLNRPPDGASLYPGQTTTGLCPLETFHGEPLYRAGQEPDDAEIARRLDTYWHPYHAALRAELDSLRRRHGFALLWEAHSINGFLPRLFDGALPDLNFGTADGKSCAYAVAQAVEEAAREAPYSWVLNGRFKGGYITRHYGNPAGGIHAVQLEMSQRIYMNESEPFDYVPERARQVQPVLQALVESALAAARHVTAEKYLPTGAHV